MLLESHHLSLTAARTELGTLEQYLADNETFEEAPIVALLKKCPNLTVLAGSLGRGMIVANAYKYEFGIQGVVRADLVLANVSRTTVVMVEFEGGRQDSIFARSSTNQLQAWSRELDHATGQIIDWSWAISDAAKSALLAENLGVLNPSVQFLVVCGRDSFVSAELSKSRFEYRRSRLSIAGNSVVFLTYDEFARELRYALIEIGAENGAP